LLYVATKGRGGILGNEIPRLCVVGNTVNVAARLQSTADANSIQISTHIYEQLGEIDLTEFSFHIQKNENVFLKNIGSVVTYTLSMQDSSNTTEDANININTDTNTDTNINNKFHFPYPFMHGCI
jgi:class 3 adenylate cyclase